MKNILFPLLCLLSVSVFASDSLYMRRITDTLSSDYFHGRGYTNNGMQKAAEFINEEVQQLGLAVQRQTVKYPVNTFPGRMELNINGVRLRPGVDYLVSPDAKGIKAQGDLQPSDSVTWISAKERVIIQLVDKLTWSVAQTQADCTLFKVLKKSVKAPASFSCQVEAKLERSFKCENVMGVLNGTTKPDSFVVFTAHYDHLGGMGADTYFPGANDNAGGVAMLLRLAKHYIANPPAYTVVFIAFAGEEAGLVGSEYFVQHPLVKLNKIRFLLNLDLMGNGEEGITVVNATEFPKEFKMLQDTNDKEHLLAAVNSRGKARNSDHYWFTERGVPSFFIYTLGKRKAYHDVDDIAATVPWHEAKDLLRLITGFVEKL